MLEGHEIPLSGASAPIVAVDHRCAGSAGVVVQRTFPSSSTAAQNDVDAHEMPVRELPAEPLPSMSVVTQAPAPPAGFVEMTRSPVPSTPRHRPVDGHETALNVAGPAGSISSGAVQASGSARAARGPQNGQDHRRRGCGDRATSNVPGARHPRPLAIRSIGAELPARPESHPVVRPEPITGPRLARPFLTDPKSGSRTLPPSPGSRTPRSAPRPRTASPRRRR